MSTEFTELNLTELKSTDIARVAALAAIVTISSEDFPPPPLNWLFGITVP